MTEKAIHLRSRDGDDSAADRRQSRRSRHAVAPASGERVAHPQECDHRERLSRHQHPDALGRGRYEAVPHRAVGQLQAVGLRSARRCARAKRPHRSSSTNSTMSNPQPRTTTANDRCCARRPFSTPRRSQISKHRLLKRLTTVRCAGQPNLNASLQQPAPGSTMADTGRFIRWRPTRSRCRRKTSFIGTATMDRDLGYMSVLAHELGHYSGAKHRLDRQLGNRFGSQAHAAEEIIAEMTAAFVCAELGLASEPRADHAQYISHYLKLLRDDSRAIFTASAAAASKAAAYLFSFSKSVDIAMPRDISDIDRALDILSRTNDGDDLVPDQTSGLSRRPSTAGSTSAVATPISNSAAALMPDTPSDGCTASSTSSWRRTDTSAGAARDRRTLRRAPAHLLRRAPPGARDRTSLPHPRRARRARELNRCRLDMA